MCVGTRVRVHAPQVFDEADEMLKAEAFADDSVRLIKNIRKKNPRVGKGGVG